MKNAENLPTTPGSTIMVQDDFGFTRLYVLALYGVWKPIEVGVGYGVPADCDWVSVD